MNEILVVAGLVVCVFVGIVISTRHILLPSTDCRDFGQTLRDLRPENLYVEPLTWKPPSRCLKCKPVRAPTPPKKRIVKVGFWS
jgi:hypothetical protein